MLFDPPPTPGSSGGPIVEEESGAVVGMMLGTQMRNRLEGLSGWGAPSELIFEVCCRRVFSTTSLILLEQMFSLPGLKLKSHN